MPARFGPMSFGINRSVGEFAFLAVLLMPDAAASPQQGTIDGHRSPAGGPGLDQVEQMPTQAANLGRQRIGDGFQASFPGTTGWEGLLLCY